ncbi:MAG TPA: argininosuccinate lyase, partial [Pyrinomonadaceae bacterium]|nr:argininosuccinate lyase [Pyrinomonadaceae bacterium]
EGLFRAGILNETEFESIQNGLQTILENAESLPHYFDELNSEDVHSFIEARLIELIGDTGRKLHTGRSRNDQVATAFRLWLREEVGEILNKIKNFQAALIESAEKHSAAILPGYTHLQRAQPILWAHWCLAYFEMLERDRQRLIETGKRVNILPLGSAALAGTNYNTNRAEIAVNLGFAGVSQNSLDAVSDRDFAIEFVGDSAILMMHLSRFAEDLIIYATQEFGFIELSDAVSTGSSLMPQKKNPDALELVRGKSARVFGHHAALLALMKGLPLAYNKDMQEDKEAVFDTVDTVSETLAVSAIVLQNLRVNEEKTRKAAAAGFLNATELADYLVKKGIPFREAHDTVGKIVLRAIEKGVELENLFLAEMQEFSPAIEEDVFEALTLEATLKNKSNIGGTAPELVAKRILEIKEN